MKNTKGSFLKECMADSLIELLKCYPIEKISINMIAEKAGVGRATWFRHFNSKNEALTFKLVTLWYSWTDARGLNRSTKYTADNALDFFEFSLKTKEIYALIYKNNLQSVIYDAFYQIVIPQHRDDPIECYKSRFISIVDIIKLIISRYRIDELTADDAIRQIEKELRL